VKCVRLIRHGESAANAGEASLNHASIPLTAKGVEQAHLVARSFAFAPALIITSPFSRAHTTAQATVAVFPDTPLETWRIQEFTYLEPARCAGTTIAQRRNWVAAYWAETDPEFRDGPGAESFLDFISRAQSFLIRVQAHPAQDIAVFAHGQLINAVAWLIERMPQQIDGQAMADWREYDIANHVPNCGGYTLIKPAADAAWSVTILVPGGRVEALPTAGYPLPDDLPLHGEQTLTDAISTRSSQVGVVSDQLSVELSAREVCQILREVTWGRRTMTKVGDASWDGIYAGHLHVRVDDWELSIYNDCDELDYCEECVSPDGRRWSFDSGDRYGTDPIALLSTWEHQTLEQMLKEL
jgi:probable phosphoglycerate mutase